ncbi:MAG TPA: PA2169 family four-helix-bundle protein [Steroidobacteraceae bacterium]
MSHRFTIATLSELLRVTQDCTRTLRVCAQHAQGASLRMLLNVLVQRSSSASGELQMLIAQLGGDAEASGSARMRLRLRQGLRQLPELWVPEDDDAAIEACERGEDHALELYRNALDDHLPDFVRQTVTRQFEDLVGDQDRIRIFRSEPPRGGGTSLGGHAHP